MRISENIKRKKAEIPEEVTLVAISKTKPESDILEAYNTGHRVFGENKIQEMTEKWEQLPKDIKWHMVGHVQRNKVKYMAEFVDLIHAVDSLKLLKEIEKQAEKYNRTIPCLLQIKIAEEDTKYGIDVDEAKSILQSDAYRKMSHVKIVGLMGMATLTEKEEKIRKEFSFLKTTFEELKSRYDSFTTLSMGMSGDYKIAIECGSTIIRVGSSIFGERNYN
ncbi:YggS family pyridoxal phosphate-dependent enzyme [Salinimicrobium sediminilitoris]|uniref:YggS family pyridoxal phosphate-dependent enzyme n=1 Tax=Salinimicrobium sediminilitoris TaxID=2876715 RepID=UPI001E335D15|nr:YggS family pyridoxal phosphate-dependent enzyme [Salinimicrobium sediminilitoris]MCC8361242.1 YggS family pyridoxal phosphate-dependent enzyme [Salinimicrobium sediminilitoris]